MNLEITAEVLLSQLGYVKTEQTISQMSKIIANTVGFDKFSKHLISFNDKLKHLNGFIAMSNSENILKVKCGNADASAILQEFHHEVEHFAYKYGVEFKKLENKEVYYIVGKS